MSIPLDTPEMLRTIASRFSVRSFATDIAACSALGGMGDVLCQLGVERREWPSQWRWPRTDEPYDERIFDPRRVASLTVFTGAYVGGFLHFLFQIYPFAVFAAARTLPLGGPLRSRLLDERTLAHAHGCGWVDNVHNGAIYIPAYFLGVGLLQGDGLAESRDNLRAEWWPTYASATAVWVPYMSLNFLYVPPRRRVQVMAIGNLAWCIVIDYLAHRSISVSRASSASSGTP